MILPKKKQPDIYFFNVSTHFCECGTVQSGHLKSPARTKVNIYKIIFPKNKGTFIILMTVVIQYANAYFNLKNQDFWCGHLRTDQDNGCLKKVSKLFQGSFKKCSKCSFLGLTNLSVRMLRYFS